MSPLAPRPSPLTLLATKGHPATGKSAVAEALARMLHWPLIDKDDAKDHILGLPGANDLAYAIMWQIAETQLALGLSTIAVSPLAYPDGYTKAQEVVRRYGARLLVIETVVPDEEWRRRLELRTPGYSTHKISGWEAMQRQLRLYNGCWQYPIDPDEHMVVDTTAPIQQIANNILQRLQVTAAAVDSRAGS